MEQHYYISDTNTV